MSRKLKARLYMPWNVVDYRAATGNLSDMEDLLYRRLLEEYWLTQKPLPDDEKQLAHLARMGLLKFRKLFKRVRVFFSSNDGLLYNKRSEEELTIASEKTQKAAESANQRWCGRNTDAVKGKGKGKEEEVTTTVTDTTVSESSQKLVLDTSVVGRSSKKSKTDSKRGSRWPKGQLVPENWIEDVHSKFAAAGLTFDGARREAEKFAEWWPTVPGVKGLKLDWELTFNVWIRTFLDRQPTHGGTRQFGKPRPSPVQQAIDLAKYFDDKDGEDGE